MAIFKCKMCGGALDIKNGETVCQCEYCGTKQTVPKLDDEKKQIYMIEQIIFVEIMIMIKQ